MCGGAGVYCPEGSAAPIEVYPGYYTVGGHEIRKVDADGGLKYVTASSPDTRVDQARCEPGFFCTGDGIRTACPAGRYGQPVAGLAGLTSAECSGPCQRGFYCPEGSTQPMQEPCPRGRYGAVEGLKDASCSGACEKGFKCLPGTVTPQLASARIGA